LPPPYQAVIFDMDGVLVDTEPLHLRALNQVLAKSGFRISEEENEQLIGTTFQSTWSYLIKRFGLEDKLELYAPAYDEAVLHILNEPLAPAPGSVSLLSELRARATPLALASSSKRLWIDATLRSLGVREYFPIVVSGDDVSHGKPAPDIFLLTATQLGFAPERCLVIEDSPNGIASGRAAGMDVIAVRTPATRRLPLENATTIVDSLEDIDPHSLGLQ
jgi:HAD superfamily hydrolase (TIGR01509 family)